MLFKDFFRTARLCLSLTLPQRDLSPLFPSPPFPSHGTLYIQIGSLHGGALSAPPAGPGHGPGRARPPNAYLTLKNYHSVGDTKSTNNYLLSRRSRHGASDLHQRCLKMRTSKDGCTFPPNIFVRNPQIPHKTTFWGPFSAKPIIESFP